ncbi:MAG: TlpA family protein disulfide reductase [Deltaproteobacteria bacterium]|nr:TlpA family protein disulfide reductase [Deltaproteobacteria bacterium]
MAAPIYSHSKPPVIPEGRLIRSGRASWITALSAGVALSTISAEPERPLIWGHESLPARTRPFGQEAAERSPLQGELQHGEFMPGVRIEGIFNAPRVISLSDLTGKIIVLEFWATWCPQCIRNIPALESLQRKHRDKLAVVMLTDESRQEVERFFRHRGEIPSLLTATKAGQAFFRFEVEARPHVVVIAPSGELAFSGIAPNEQQFKAVIEPLLTGTAPTQVLPLRSGYFANFSGPSLEPGTKRHDLEKTQEVLRASKHLAKLLGESENEVPDAAKEALSELLTYFEAGRGESDMTQARVEVLDTIMFAFHHEGLAPAVHNIIKERLLGWAGAEAEQVAVRAALAEKFTHISDYLSLSERYKAAARLTAWLHGRTSYTPSQQVDIERAADTLKHGVPAEPAPSLFGQALAEMQRNFGRWEIFRSQEAADFARFQEQSKARLRRLGVTIDAFEAADGGLWTSGPASLQLEGNFAKDKQKLLHRWYLATTTAELCQGSVLSSEVRSYLSRKHAALYILEGGRYHEYDGALLNSLAATGADMLSGSTLVELSKKIKTSRSGFSNKWLERKIQLQLERRMTIAGESQSSGQENEDISLKNKP